MKPEEVIAAYSMEQLWQMKLKQVAEMINNEAIDVDSLIQSLVFYSNNSSCEILDAFDDVFGVLEDLRLYELFFGADKKTEEKLAWLNELRFTDLPSLVKPTKAICAPSLMIVYKIHADCLRRHYKENNGRRRSNSFILDYFYCYIGQPYLMLAPSALLNNKTLRGYFALSNLLKENEKVYPKVFDFAMGWVTGSNGKEKQLYINVSPSCSFECLVVKEKFDHLWLFFWGPM